MIARELVEGNVLEDWNMLSVIQGIWVKSQA
jgi:hypothetical protein